VLEPGNQYNGTLSEVIFWEVTIKRARDVIGTFYDWDCIGYPCFFCSPRNAWATEETWISNTIPIWFPIFCDRVTFRVYLVGHTFYKDTDMGVWIILQILNQQSYLDNLWQWSVVLQIF
jgi:hypothetical protein